eukprot:GHUV01048747.1.p1 GENE.GHUV01048747.1~~GHUV01048747.1.p1  ORF type:complete len:160 (+),score=37.33 GHUV01048747.1:128-607(+)
MQSSRVFQLLVAALAALVLALTPYAITGERPPITQEEWLAEFAKYQQSPEFRLAHSHMSVEDFKFIYYMEWAHRMWGRILGLAFAVPATYFAARGYINGPLGKRLGICFLMGGAQGLVGWWMVRSGLQVGDDGKLQLLLSKSVDHSEQCAVWLVKCMVL